MTNTNTHGSTPVRIAIVGTGNIARALGTRWAQAGHPVTLTGRSAARGKMLAAEIGHGAIVATPQEAVRGADVLLLAIPWASLDQALALLGAENAALAGISVIDPINPVEHGVGRHLMETGSVSQYIASRAPEAHVVKAFNVHPSAHWEHATPRDVVTLAGNDRGALKTVGELVCAVGATPHTLGGLERARQLEELSATVIALAFAGVDPRSAIPGL